MAADDTTDQQMDLQCDIMLEGMEAIRNISGGLRAWDLKDDAERLSAIHAISEALYNFDMRSEVALGVSRETLSRLGNEHSDLAAMCPKAFAWLDAP